MPLENNMTHDMVINYLAHDLRISVENDVAPIIQPQRREGGYFAVPRLVLCYIDFLASLYIGYNGQMARDRRIISNSRNAKIFIRDIMGEIDVNYQNHGDLLWEMYRNGLVHQYEPKTFINRQTQNRITWVAYKGRRIDRLIEGQYQLRVSHLIPINHSPNEDIFPISINCLYDDLIVTIDNLIQKYQDEANRNERILLDRWISTANAIKDPEITDINW